MAIGFHGQLLFVTVGNGSSLPYIVWAVVVSQCMCYHTAKQTLFVTITTNCKTIEELGSYSSSAVLGSILFLS